MNGLKCTYKAAGPSFPFDGAMAEARCDAGDLALGEFTTTTQKQWTVSELVSWCFKPSQTQRIISGLKKTFIKIYIVERTSKAELRPEKTESESGEMSGEFME